MSGIYVILVLIWLVRLLMRDRESNAPFIEEPDYGSGRLIEEPPSRDTLPVGGNLEEAVYQALEQGAPPPLEPIFGADGKSATMQTFWVHHMAMSFRVAFLRQFVAEAPLSGNAWAAQAVAYALAAAMILEEEPRSNAGRGALVACGHAATLGSDSLTATARALVMVSRDEYAQASAYMLEQLAESQDVIAAVVFTLGFATRAPTQALDFARKLAERSAPASGLHAALFVAHRTAVRDDAVNARRILYPHVAELYAALQALQSWQPPSAVDAYVWSYVASVYAMLEDADPARAALRRVGDRIVVDAWVTKDRGALGEFTIARETYC